MTSSSHLDDDSNARRAPRSSMYLAATLYAGSHGAPVKVRNMSSNGALVEAASAPAPGTNVKLERGWLEAEGLVVWTKDGRFGVEFTGSVDVPQWLAPIANGNQLRVDRIVQMVKTGVPLPAAGSSAAETMSPPQVERSLADHLACSLALLARLEDDLADDPDVLTRHYKVIQNLDIAMQMIRAVSACVGDARPASTAARKLRDLRQSAEQALGTADRQT